MLGVCFEGFCPFSGVEGGGCPSTLPSRVPGGSQGVRNPLKESPQGNWGARAVAKNQGVKKIASKKNQNYFVEGIHLVYSISKTPTDQPIFRDQIQTVYKPFYQLAHKYLKKKKLLTAGFRFFLLDFRKALEHEINLGKLFVGKI